MSETVAGLRFRCEPDEVHGLRGRWIVEDGHKRFETYERASLCRIPLDAHQHRVEHKSCPVLTKDPIDCVQCLLEMAGPAPVATLEHLHDWARTAPPEESDLVYGELV